MKDPILVEALNRVGGASALSAVLGVSSQAISQWRRVPPMRVRAVAEASGIADWRLRPDLYSEPADLGEEAA